jgi:hypothetical protein
VPCGQPWSAAALQTQQALPACLPAAGRDWLAKTIAPSHLAYPCRHWVTGNSCTPPGTPDQFRSKELEDCGVSGNVYPEGEGSIGEWLASVSVKAELRCLLSCLRQMSRSWQRCLLFKAILFVSWALLTRTDPVSSCLLPAEFWNCADIRTTARKK